MNDLNFQLRPVDCSVTTGVTAPSTVPLRRTAAASIESAVTFPPAGATVVNELRKVSPARYCSIRHFRR